LCGVCEPRATWRSGETRERGGVLIADDGGDKEGAPKSGVLCTRFLK
jgi:hypothetical protein